MNRHLPKTFVISLVSFVLLYYSTAWAVLRCFHAENHSDHAVALYDTDVHGKNAYRPSTIDLETNIDCLDLAYHTESLAGPSSSPQLHRWATRTIPHVADYLNSPRWAEDGARNFWLRAVFDGPAGVSFFIDARRYLSLSILRI
jgi:hypothetical protein